MDSWDKKTFGKQLVREEQYFDSDIVAVCEEGKLPNFNGKISAYMIKYRSKDKIV